jgi:20S proteasome alpha/beta subunit
MKTNFALAIFSWFIDIFTYGSPFPTSHNYYDKEISRFSSDGRIMQVEYAKKAGSMGASILAGCSHNQAVLMLPYARKLSFLQSKSSSDKVIRIDSTSVLAISGLGGDSRAIAKLLRTFSVRFWKQFGTNPSPLALSKFLADTQHETTLIGGMTHLLLPPAY